LHELSITQNIIEIATEKARDAGARRVTGLSIVVGSLTGIAEECVKFYFEFVAKDTMLEGANMEFRLVPSLARCRACKVEFSPEEGSWHCPGCGSLNAEIVAGRELFLESIEVDRD
jgi:hydrogenase nickel incorporation protein HypA/HybF